MNAIGIMQGRLSPAGLVAQAFPWKSWEEEFDRAHRLGFEAIEWLWDSPDFEQNPLWTEAGVARIRSLVRATGVVISSVCANYFMQHPFFRVTEAEARQSSQRLCELIERAQAVGANKILVPVLEQAEMRTPAEQTQLLHWLEAPLIKAGACNVALALETELPAEALSRLMAEADNPSLGVYYDTGNATARGYEAAADLRQLASHVRGVHIKDRARGGPNVPLGTGDVDFEAVGAAITQIGYAGSLILETTVGNDWQANAAHNLEYLRLRLGTRPLAGATGRA